MNSIHDGEARELKALDRVRISTNRGKNVTAIYVDGMADIGRVSEVVKRDGWMGRLKRWMGYVLGREDRLVSEGWLAKEFATDPIV